MKTKKFIIVAISVLTLFSVFIPAMLKAVDDPCERCLTGGTISLVPCSNQPLCISNNMNRIEARKDGAQGAPFGSMNEVLWCEGSSNYLNVGCNSTTYIANCPY